MHLYGLKTCDTCRNALKRLGDVEFVDVRAEGVPEHVLSRAHDQFGGALLNSRSATWRGLSEAERARPALELLRDYPALMKRPLIVRDDEMWLGWDDEVQAALG
ncbi:arsenate reductase [Salinihabitans flavidus]|uniref:Arsenate reductase n=1 Tax=Salinihabitans flavidus TaxID=569882 RepID=A0A1H8R8K4_9RHOB|nr:ArsC/Spx/MgsR family protein [Salinihabitans flavidus]SEO62691.1 arsenate reductase [Salinihabitans flavidus]